MKRLCIICEGITEQNFVKTTLEPHLRNFGLCVAPPLIRTRPGKPGGGDVTVARVVEHIYCEYPNFNFITTFLDFYAFHDKEKLNKNGIEQKILTATLLRRPQADPKRVIPYLQMHEFEALLFSDIEKFYLVLDGWNKSTREELKKIVGKFGSPEEINNHPSTSPSNILRKIFSDNFSKTEHGPLIAQEIGLNTIRKACPSFDDWVRRLESLHTL